jgi:hypothetical protein
VSSAEVIEQIKRLPRDERRKVIHFAQNQADNEQLSPEELGELTRQMVESNDPVEKARLKQEIKRGFYGNEPHA